MNTNPSISDKEEIFNGNLPEEVQKFLREKYEDSGIALNNCDARIQFLESRLKYPVSLTFFSPKQVGENIKKRIRLFELERQFLIKHGFLA